jgi:hypothetical protein
VGGLLQLRTAEELCSSKDSTKVAAV